MSMCLGLCLNLEVLGEVNPKASTLIFGEKNDRRELRILKYTTRSKLAPTCQS